MTVICPSCDARFRDPPAEVLNSRPLQCSKCEHEWHHERIKVNAPSMAPDFSDLVGDPNGIKTNLPVVMPQRAAPSKREPIYVDREPAPKLKRSTAPLWTATGLVCVAAFAGSIYFKDLVIAKAPRTAALFSAAGIASNTPGLEIGNVVTTRNTRDGIRQLIVRGEIENIAAATVPVPPIKLTMRGKGDANLFAWTVSSTKSSLTAGEKSRFTAIAHDFPDDAVNVEVEFEPVKSKDGE